MNIHWQPTKHSDRLFLMQRSDQLHGKKMKGLTFEPSIRYPDLVGIETEKEERYFSGGAGVTLEDVRVTFSLEQQSIRVQASARKSSLSWLRALRGLLLL